MHFSLKIVGAVALFAAVALLLAPVALPPFLDRTYYQGPVTDHFDGQRFFNPEDRTTGAQPTARSFSLIRMVRFLRGKDRAAWPSSVPVVQTVPPRRVDGTAMRVTWIGHSTMLVQSDGLNILTDPIWSSRAGPFDLAGPKRVRAPGVRFADLPRIDLVLVSHDHYDHMDLPTLRRLWARDRPLIVTSLGNDTILKAHGIGGAVARDWGGRVTVKPGVAVIVERVHHWGSRWGADRNRALWSGFTVTLPGGNLFFAGDTGWGDGAWVREAARDGPFRLALIPIGAYRPRAMMSGSHIDPAQAAAVFRGLGARFAAAVHWGTFQLSYEAFDAPPHDLEDALAKDGIAADRFRALVPGQGWEVPATLLDPSPSPREEGGP